MEKIELPFGQIKIIFGPNKFDVMSSLFDGKVVNIQCSLSETTKDIKFLQIIFVRVEPDEHINNEWVGKVKVINYANKKLDIRYNTEKKKGYIINK
jgi:hypothetical protein